MEQKSITVIIPTFNEAHQLEAAVETVRWADEILVVDSFSTDGTADLARKLGVRVLEHEYVNSATQKNWTIPQASHPWVMILDADERVTPELAQELQEFLAAPEAYRGVRIFRKNHFMGRPVNYCGWQDDSVLRIFPRDTGRYIDREVHADVLVDGPVKIARHRLLHFTFTSFQQYMKKFDQYTTWAAGDRARKTKRVGLSHLLLRPAARFLRQYIIRLGFLDGRTGAIICLLSSFSVFLKYAKLWERQQRAEDVAAASTPSAPPGA